jgi:hypothetical protein
MLTPVCQRWRERRDSYRTAREPFDPRACEVAAIPDDTTARAFVEAHHYERTLPPARFRFGLYERDELVGVAVFSVPAQDAVTACLPGERDERTELGRLVLLDRVLANAESWFVARCFDALRREGLTGVVSFSDPTPRSALDGRLVMPGHVGNVYQALSAVYLGTTRVDTTRLLPDGTAFSNRAAAKIRKGECGWRYAVDRLVAHGATPPRSGEEMRTWLARELPRVTRSQRGAKHKYAWTLLRRDRRHLPASKPYPKLGAPARAMEAA